MARQTELVSKGNIKYLKVFHSKFSISSSLSLSFLFFFFEGRREREFACAFVFVLCVLFYLFVWFVFVLRWLFFSEDLIIPRQAKRSFDVVCCVVKSNPLKTSVLLREPEAIITVLPNSFFFFKLITLPESLKVWNVLEVLQYISQFTKFSLVR